MTPRKLGQHFLADAGWRARILDQLAPAADQVWLEIGAGTGEMTVELARRSARVVAIELDRSLLDSLRRAVTGLPVEVVAGDVLELDLAKLAGPRCRVYGSLPYYITSPILRRVLAISERIEEIVVVIQREVAERLIAKPRTRDYGLLSVLVQLRARPDILLRIPPGAFRPPPKVESALVRLRPPGEKQPLGLSDEDEDRFLGFVEACFAHKRKTLTNNLKSRYQPTAIAEALAALELNPKSRAEELEIGSLVQLWKQLGQAQSARRI